MKNIKWFNVFSFVPLCPCLTKFCVVMICGISFFSPTKTFSQQSNIPLNHEWLQEIEARTISKARFEINPWAMCFKGDSCHYTIDGKDTLVITADLKLSLPLHSSMRPWTEQGHPIRKNSLIQNSTNEHIIFDTKSRWPKWFQNYHSKSSLIQVEKQAHNGEPLFRLYIDPVLNLQGQNMRRDEDAIIAGLYYINTRGINAHGDIGTKLSFETSFYENQAFVPAYIRKFANEALVIPGQGRWKRFHNNGYDYAMAMGYLSYSPHRNFNIQIGTGKHFVGDGYRSLLLSDNSFAYPFARLTGWFGPNKMFQYTSIYSSLMNLFSAAPIPMGTERLYQKKAASFYQLSANIGSFAEISLFQGLIWTAADNRNKQSVQPAYLNPLIFSSIPFYGLNDRRNFLVGATFHVDFIKTLRLYGQIVLDELDKKGTIGNKKGFQLGVKYYNAFKLKHLHLQAEYNQVNPYTYSSSDSAQAYTHYNQPLAHPLGANFSEIVGSAQYKFGDFFIHMRISNAWLGTDTAGRDFGQNMFLSDVNAYNLPVDGQNKLGQGEKTFITYFDGSVGYMISYASNLNISLGFTDRKVYANETLNHTQYVYVAIRTSLTNNYLDFFR